MKGRFRRNTPQCVAREWGDIQRNMNGEHDMVAAWYGRKGRALRGRFTLCTNATRSQTTTILFVENVFTHRRMYSHASVCLTTAERGRGRPRRGHPCGRADVVPCPPWWRGTLVTPGREGVGRRGGERLNGSGCTDFRRCVVG